jgi:hypothetical protein
MTMPINSGSETGEFLRLMADWEHDDPEQAPTCRLPVLCPEAFAVAGMSDEEAIAALEREFPSRVAA